jgi:hypothetical protein
MRTKKIKPVYRFGLLAPGDKFWLHGELFTASRDGCGYWAGSSKRNLHVNCVIEPVDRAAAGRSRAKWVREAIRVVLEKTGARLSRQEIIDTYRSLVWKGAWRPAHESIPVDMPKDSPMFLALQYLDLVVFVPHRHPCGTLDYKVGKWIVCGTTTEFLL